MISAVIAMTIFGFPTHSTQATTTRPAPGWTLKVAHDAFSGEARCRLEGRDVRYGHDTLSFHFPSHVDTSFAFYRVDQQPPRSWRDGRLELARLGMPLSSDNTANPSNGRVPIPASALTGAQSVTIRPSRNARPRTFSIQGFDQALASARSAGCDPMRSF